MKILCYHLRNRQNILWEKSYNNTLRYYIDARLKAKEKKQTQNLRFFKAGKHIDPDTNVKVVTLLQNSSQ